MVTGDAEREFAAMLVGLEAKHNDAGWDAPPRLLLASYPQHDGVESVLMGVEITPPQMIAGDGYANPGDVLAFTIESLIHLVKDDEPLGHAMLASLREKCPNVYSVIFVFEAYVHFTRSRDDAGDFLTNPQAVPLADRVESKEMRCVHAVDVTGNLYAVNHVRGRPASRAVVSRLDSNAHAVQGDVPRLLAQLLALIVGDDPDKYARALGGIPRRLWMVLPEGIEQR